MTNGLAIWSKAKSIHSMDVVVVVVAVSLSPFAWLLCVTGAPVKTDDALDCVEGINFILKFHKKKTGSEKKKCERAPSDRKFICFAVFGH